jgi:hypothetical protein
VTPKNNMVNIKLLIPIALTISMILSTSCVWVSGSGANVNALNSNLEKSPEPSNLNKDGQIANSPSSHNYFDADPEFRFWMTDENNIPVFKSPISAIYLQQTQDADKKYSSGLTAVFKFETSDTDSPINLRIPIEIARNIELIPGETYQIISENDVYAFGLVIHNFQETKFIGITDSNLREHIASIFSTYFSANLIRQTRVLENNYLEGVTCYKRITNTEIEFQIGNNTVLLHQGQSATLGGYQITLSVARNAEGGHCIDDGISGISYSIAKIK